MVRSTGNMSSVLPMSTWFDVTMLLLAFPGSSLLSMSTWLYVTTNWITMMSHR